MCELGVEREQPPESAWARGEAVARRANGERAASLHPGQRPPALRTPRPSRARRRLPPAEAVDARGFRSRLNQHPERLLASFHERMRPRTSPVSTWSHDCPQLSLRWVNCLAMRDIGLRIRAKHDLRDRFTTTCPAQDTSSTQVLREFMGHCVASHDIVLPQNAGEAETVAPPPTIGHENHLEELPTIASGSVRFR